MPRILYPASQRELDLHLTECTDCRATLEDFRQVARELEAEPRGVECSTALEPSSFVEFAEARGVPFSIEAREALLGHKERLWTLPRMAYAAAALLLVAGTSVGLTLEYAKARVPAPLAEQTKAQSPLVTPAETEGNDSKQAQQITNLKGQLDKALLLANQTAALKQQIAAGDKERGQLTVLIGEREGDLQRLQKSAGETERKLTAAQATVTALREKEGGMTADLADARFRATNLAEEPQFCDEGGFRRRTRGSKRQRNRHQHDGCGGQHLGRSAIRGKHAVEWQGYR